MSESKHHLFSPSSLARRSLCPASAHAEVGLPSYETEAAAEGTELHAKIAELITSFCYAEKAPSFDDDRIGEAFAVFLDKCGVSCAETAKNEIQEAIATGKLNVLVEYPVKYNYCYIEQYNGTADVVILMPEKAVIIDWKFGHREVAEAADNPQGAAYALAVMQEFKKESVEVCFFNPSIHQRTEATFNDRAALAEAVMDIIYACQNDDAPYRPSEDACRYCKASHFGTCPALGKVSYDLTVAAKMLPRLEEMTDDALSDFAEKAAIIDKLNTEIKAEIMRRCEANGTCGGYRVKVSSGGRQIEDVSEAFSKCGLPADTFLDCVTLSVSTLEKAYADANADKFATKKEAKAAFADLLKDLITEKSPRKSLVKEK